MGNQSQDEVFLAAQEAVGAHRDSQGPLLNESNQSHIFRCDQCSKQYYHRGSLRRHQKVECGKTKSIICKICGHGFYYKQEMQYHMYNKHKDLLNVQLKG